MNIIIIVILLILCYTVYNVKHLENLLKSGKLMYSFSKSYKMSKVPFLTFTYTTDFEEQKELTFLIDTGANVNFILQNTIDDIKPDWKKDIEMDNDITTISGTIEQNKSVPLLINLNNYEFEDRFVITNNNVAFEQMSSDYHKPIVGILGSEFLKKYNFDIDYKNLNITLK